MHACVQPAKLLHERRRSVRCLLLQSVPTLFGQLSDKPSTLTCSYLKCRHKEALVRCCPEILRHISTQQMHNKLDIQKKSGKGRRFFTCTFWEAAMDMSNLNLCKRSCHAHASNEIMSCASKHTPCIALSCRIGFVGVGAWPIACQVLQPRDTQTQGQRLRNSANDMRRNVTSCKVG